jgi:hypothetical protein
MRDELMEDLQEFETNQMNLEEYMSNEMMNNGLMNQSMEMMSNQSYGLHNISHHNSVKESKKDLIQDGDKNEELEELRNEIKKYKEDFQIEEQKNIQNCSKIQVLELDKKHLKEKIEQNQLYECNC